jgi:aryl-alcohol dehydrogenase (NADP+)
MGMTASQFATAWVLANKHVTSVICGPRTAQQLGDYITAADRRLTAECEALVDSLVVPGHPSTPGYRDPMEPVEGRAAFSSAA